MCGINGIFRFDGQAVRESDLRPMNDGMFHRGPDDEGYYCSGNLGFAVRRLSIIDISGGHQPLSNEDGRYWVALNGEIYNYIELREELEGRGHIFKTKTDTEVLVHLYEELAERCVERLNGMFVFAVWDSISKELFIATDRLGIKPLFYFYERKSALFFSSELKSLMSMDFDKRIDYASYVLYLFLMYVPYPKSLLEGVCKLEPATWLKVKEQGEIIKKTYWDTGTARQDEIVDKVKFKEQFLALLSDAVRLQMRSDVPVGTFLSGGIDSSCIVAMLSMLNSRNPVRTFSLGYEGHHIDERPYALEVSRLFKSEHTEYFLTKESVMNNLRRIVWYMDEPMGDSAAVPTFLLSEAARSAGVKVLLNGTGGDEIFGGYKRYIVNGSKAALMNRIKTAARMFQGFSAKPAFLKATARLNNPLINYLEGISGSYTGMLLFAETAKVFDDMSRNLNSLMAAPFNRLCGGDEAGRLMDFDLKTYLVGDLLFLLDKMTMGASVEGRVPLLDHRLVEFMGSFSSSARIENGNLKALVKSSLEGILPDNIITRKKMGFGSPVLFWLQENIFDGLGVFGEGVSDITSKAFDLSSIRRVAADRRYNRWNSQFLYNLAIFELWHQEVFKKFNE